MSRILFDVNVPRPAARFLVQHVIEFADRRGWRELGNGDLLAVAEADGFEVFLTADLNVRYQQNLAERQIAIVALSTNHWATVRAASDLIAAAINRAQMGGYEEVTLPRPPRRRRPASDKT